MSVSGSDFDDLLRPREVAELLGVRTATVARWARDGLLKAVIETPGGHRRYRRGEVLALREANSRGPSAGGRKLAEDAVRLYGQGWSLRRVAEEFGWGYSRMRRLLGAAWRAKNSRWLRGERPACESPIREELASSKSIEIYGACPTDLYGFVRRWLTCRVVGWSSWSMMVRGSSRRSMRRSLRPSVGGSLMAPTRPARCCLRNRSLLRSSGCPGPRWCGHWKR